MITSEILSWTWQNSDKTRTHQEWRPIIIKRLKLLTPTNTSAVYLTQLRCEANTELIVKQCQQRIRLIRNLSSFKVCGTTVCNFYHCFFERPLTAYFICWFNGSSVKNRSSLRSLVKVCSKIQEWCGFNLGEMGGWESKKYRLESNNKWIATMGINSICLNLNQILTVKPFSHMHTWGRRRRRVILTGQWQHNRFQLQRWRYPRAVGYSSTLFLPHFYPITNVSIHHVIVGIHVQDRWFHPDKEDTNITSLHTDHYNKNLCWIWIFQLTYEAFLFWLCFYSHYLCPSKMCQWCLKYNLSGEKE